MREERKHETFQGPRHTWRRHACVGSRARRVLCQPSVCHRSPPGADAGTFGRTVDEVRTHVTVFVRCRLWIGLCWLSVLCRPVPNPVARLSVSLRSVSQSFQFGGISTKIQSLIIMSAEKKFWIGGSRREVDENIILVVLRTVVWDFMLFITLLRSWSLQLIRFLGSMFQNDFEIKMYILYYIITTT